MIYVDFLLFCLFIIIIKICLYFSSPYGCVLINKSKILVNHTVTEIKNAALTLNFPIKTTGSGSSEKIEMPTNKKEIKELLNFLDEDYFNSEITKQRFRSNSKRKA